MKDSESNQPIVQNDLWSITLPIRWSDMDALGHVNNAMYFRYFEMTRMEWWNSLGEGTLGTSSIGMVVADGHCEYLIPLKYPSVITVKMSGAAPGRTSFNSFYTIHTDDGRLCARGSARVVWYDNARESSTPLPASVVALLPASK
ncbi:MAG: acyl-CoA thioesterase [Granulosicoccus sp.]|nr:acyl-CoA thioesterase [Granulosicoccus sp.]